MLPGIVCVFAFLALLVAVTTIRRQELILGRLELELRPLAEGLELLGPGAQAYVPELRELGFDLVGVYRPAPRDEVNQDTLPPEKRAPLRAVAVLADFLSRDRRTEAVIHSTSVVYEKKSARGSLSNDSLSFDSYGPKGELVKTYNLASETFLGKHPVNSWRRLPGTRSARALLAAHERHVRERPFEPVVLDPAEAERRFAQRHCEELWYLEAQRLVRFEGPLVHGTRLLRLRSLLNQIGPGLGERRPWAALGLHAVLGAAGALAAWEGPARAEPFPFAVFLALASVALAVFRRSVIGSPLYVCMPAAVAFALRGVTSPAPWIATTLFVVVANLLRQQYFFRREKERQQRVLAAARAKEGGPSASSAAGPP